MATEEGYKEKVRAAQLAALCYIDVLNYPVTPEPYMMTVAAEEGYKEKVRVMQFSLTYEL
jgi:hypothetical protein